MRRTVVRGIEKHQDLKRFTASAAEIAAKDQTDLMSRCWFSLTPNRTDPIEHQLVNLKTKQVELVRITGSSEKPARGTISAPWFTNAPAHPIIGVAVSGERAPKRKGG